MRDARNREPSVGSASAGTAASHTGRPAAASAAPPSASAAQSAITFSAATVASLSIIRPRTITTREAGAHSPPGR